VVFLALVGIGTYFLFTPPDPYPDQWFGQGKYAASAQTGVIRNVTVQIVLIHFTANGCICAGNPVNVDIDLTNQTWVDINAIAFTLSQNVPPVVVDGVTVTGELPPFNSTTDKSCPVGDVCAKGQLQWQEEGDSWMYFHLNSKTIASGFPVARAEIGTRTVHLDSQSEHNGLVGTRQSFGFGWLILAVTVFGFDALIVLIPRIVHH
jgi:hypothetical protein